MNSIIYIDNLKIPIGNHKNKKIILGADHRGFEYKEKVKYYYEKTYSIEDIGTFSPERCDYPVISAKLAGKVSLDKEFNTIGIGICGSGIGIIIPASKYKNIYAARCLTPEDAITSRKHNNINFLGLGADHMDLTTIINTIDSFLNTPFYTNENEKPYLNRYIQTLKIQQSANNNQN